MRLLGMILALGAICWVLYLAAGGGKAETAIPVEYQKDLAKAKGVEQSLQATVDKSMEDAERRSQSN